MTDVAQFTDTAAAVHNHFCGFSDIVAVRGILSFQALFKDRFFGLAFLIFPCVFIRDITSCFGAFDTELLHCH